MNEWSPAQIREAQMAGLKAFEGLTGKALEGFQRLLDLNAQTMKSTLALARDSAEKALSGKDSQGFTNLQAEFIQPAADNLLAYQRQLYDIMSATRAEFEKVAEAQYAASKLEWQSLFDKMLSNAPSGLEGQLAAWQQVVGATHTFYETVQSTARQVTQVAESSFESAANEASKGVRQRAK